MAAPADAFELAGPREPRGGLIVAPNVVTFANSSLIVALAERHRLPAIYPFAYYAKEGGLISYGFDAADQFRQGAVGRDTIHGRCNAPRCPKLHPQADALLCFLVKVYVASKAKHAVWWQALRAAGVPIAASWVDAEFNHDGSEPTQDEWSAQWERCCREAAEADITLMFARDGENQNGALLEVGSALGAGKQVFLVSPHAWSWKHHPRVRVFDTLEAAVTAIMAADCGRVRAKGGPVIGLAIIE